MFTHNRQMQYTVRVCEPNPALAGLLLEQFGGPEGELMAAMRYFAQALAEEDPERKELLLEIATEELSHLEIVGRLVVMLNRGGMGDVVEARSAGADSYCSLTQRVDELAQALLSRGGPVLTNSLGAPWTAACLDWVAGSIRDLRSNIAAESRARLAYARLIDLTDDPDVKDALAFLMIRENEHRKAFEKILLEMEGSCPPAKQRGIPKFVNRYATPPHGDGSRISDGGGLDIAAGKRDRPDGSGAEGLA
jgi:Mn-containing catalase